MTSHSDIASQNPHAALTQRLRALRRTETAVQVKQGIAACLGGVLAAVLVLGLVEAVFYAPALVRAALLVVCLVLGLCCFVWLCVRPLAHQVSLDALALRVEAGFPLLRQRLISVLQLWSRHEHNAEDYSLHMIEKLAQQTQSACLGLDFGQVIDRRPLTRSVRFLASTLLVGVAALFVFGQPLRGAFYRYRHPLTAFARPQRTFLQVIPGDCSVVKGNDVRVNVSVSGQIPERVEVSFKPVHAEVWRQAWVATGATATTTYVFRQPRSSLDYFLTAGDAQSPEFRLTVIDRPAVTQLHQRYVFPEYTGLPPRLETDYAGDISAVVGTQVSFEMAASKALKGARLVFGDGTVLPGRVDGRIARAAVTVQRSGTYHIDLVDLEGVQNVRPIQYRVVAIPDEGPTVRVVRPGGDTDIGENMLVGLTVEAGDDFGISALYLVHQRPQRKPQRLPIPLGLEGEAEVAVEYLWDLSQMELLPEDQVTYFMEAYDNDTISGPKIGRSESFVVRFPSVYEIVQEIEREQQLQVDGLAQIVEEGRAVQQELEALQRDLLREQDLDWEKKQEAAALLSRKREMAQKLQEITNGMGQSADKLEKSGIATLETLEKFAEIQELLSEIASPQLDKAMDKIQKAMDQLDAEQLRRALEEFSVSGQEYQRKLERTLAILKRVQIGQKMDALIKQADELVQRQQDVNQRALPPFPSFEQLSAEQRDLERDTGRLQNDLETLGTLMEGVPGMPHQELQRLAEQTKSDDLPGQMSLLSELLESARQDASVQAGQRVAGQLRALRDGLSALRERMKQGLMQQIEAELNKGVRDLLFLSERQEGVLAEAERIHPRSPRFGELAQSQQWLLGSTVKVADDLYETSQKTFFVGPSIAEAMGQALANMELTLKGLEQRQKHTAPSRAEDAMVALNRTVMLLRQALADARRGSSPIGFEEMLAQLEKLAEQQQAINDQTRGKCTRNGLPLPRFGPGGTLSPNEQALLARLAAEQEAVRRALRELEESLSARRNVLGRLDQMTSEVEEVVRDLKRQQVDQQTIQRQQQILSRLLDARRSVRERGYSRRRESQTGREYAARSPGGLPTDMGERESLLREDLLKALKEGYSRQYEELIRRYFEALSREGLLQ